jgi:glycosyltransferase involved in cell wall biosynthesis
MTAVRPLQVLLVDPSLFTAPYDAALTDGLLAAGVEPVWITRPTRQGDTQELPVERTDPFFYRHVDEAAGWLGRLKPVLKGLSHIAGLVTLLSRVRLRHPDVVHFQWTVVPLLDSLAMLLIRRWCALVLTVHDTVPFNGERMSFLQNAGFDLPMRVAHRVIVHTASGREALIRRGVPAAKIMVVPHGTLRLKVPLPPQSPRSDGRFSFLLFGEIKPYKGLDVLIEALGQLPRETLEQVHVVIAGRPRMDLMPIEARIAALKLGSAIELRPTRQSEEEMATLFAATDCFLFPYHQIDASGVWFLTKSLGRWVIASRVGIFEAELQEGRQGVLLPPGDSTALAHAIAQAVLQRPKADPVCAVDEWAAIGIATRRVYEAAALQMSSSSLAGAGART